MSIARPDSPRGNVVLFSKKNHLLRDEFNALTAASVDDKPLLTELAQRLGARFLVEGWQYASSVGREDKKGHGRTVLFYTNPDVPLLTKEVGEAAYLQERYRTLPRDLPMHPSMTRLPESEIAEEIGQRAVSLKFARTGYNRITVGMKTVVYQTGVVFIDIRWLPAYKEVQLLTLSRRNLLNAYQNGQVSYTTREQYLPLIEANIERLEESLTSGQPNPFA